MRLFFHVENKERIVVFFVIKIFLLLLIDKWFYKDMSIKKSYEIITEINFQEYPK